VELFEAAQEITDLIFGRVSLAMISLCCADNNIDDIRKAATAAPPLLHAVVNLRRNDQLPAVLVEQLDNGRFDFLFCDEIAATDQHSQNH